MMIWAYPIPSGGIAAPIELPVWAGPTFTLAGVVITASVFVIVKLLRGPVEVKDLWGENRELRAEVKAVRASTDAAIASVNLKLDSLLREREIQRTYNRAFADGFDAQSRIIERMVQETGVHPKYGPGEHEAIERARALRLAVESEEGDDLSPLPERENT